MTIRLSKKRKKVVCVKEFPSFTNGKSAVGKRCRSSLHGCCICLLRKPDLQLNVLEDGQRTKASANGAKEKREMRERIS